MDIDTPQTLALDGRTLGRRGRETRQRLLAATEQMLRESGLRDLRVVDVARRVGTSPATFYQYFKDVEEAVLVLAAQAVDEIPPIVELIDEDWSGDAGLEHAEAIVSMFLDFWLRHHAVLRVRNLAAEEGDERFREVRMQAVQPITEAFERKLAGADHGMQPYAAGAAIAAMLERMGAYQFELEARGVGHADLVGTPARIVYQTVTGVPAPV